MLCCHLQKLPTLSYPNSILLIKTKWSTVILLNIGIRTIENFLIVRDCALRNTQKDYQHHSEFLRRIDMQRNAQRSTHRRFPCANWCETRLSTVAFPVPPLWSNPSHNWTTWILLMIWLSYPTPNSRCQKRPILWWNILHVFGWISTNEMQDPQSELTQ